jgi:hypothetical protein
VLHGDLRAANVLVEGSPAQPAAKLTGFGLARLRAALAREGGAAGGGEASADSGARRATPRLGV